MASGERLDSEGLHEMCLRQLFHPSHMRRPSDGETDFLGSIADKRRHWGAGRQIMASGHRALGRLRKTRCRCFFPISKVRRFIHSAYAQVQVPDMPASVRGFHSVHCPGAERTFGGQLAPNEASYCPSPEHLALLVHFHAAGLSPPLT